MARARRVEDAFRDLVILRMNSKAAAPADGGDEAVGRREQMREVGGERREERRDGKRTGYRANDGHQRLGSRNATPKSRCRVKKVPAISLPAPRRCFSVTRVMRASAMP